MARNIIGTAPFPPVVVLDRNNPLTPEELQDALAERPAGVSLCVRYEDGPDDRGGYFFHIKAATEAGETYLLFDFQKRPLDTVDFDTLLRLVNHCTGRQFDQQIFDLCAQKLNFLQDS